MSWEIEMCEMRFGGCDNTLRMVCTTFVLLIIHSNLHLHFIIREVDGRRIAGRYDVITLLHIGWGIITCSST